MDFTQYRTQPAYTEATPASARPRPSAPLDVYGPYFHMQQGYYPLVTRYQWTSVRHPDSKKPTIFKHQFGLPALINLDPNALKKHDGKGMSVVFVGSNVAQDKYRGKQPIEGYVKDDPFDKQEFEDAVAHLKRIVDHCGGYIDTPTSSTFLHNHIRKLYDFVKENKTDIVVWDLSVNGHTVPPGVWGCSKVCNLEQFIGSLALRGPVRTIEEIPGDFTVLGSPVVDLENANLLDSCKWWRDFGDLFQLYLSGPDPGWQPSQELSSSTPSPPAAHLGDFGEVSPEASTSTKREREISGGSLKDRLKRKVINWRDRVRSRTKSD